MLLETPHATTERPLPTPVCRIDDLVLDIDQHSLKRGAESIPLPRLSFQLLSLLARKAPHMVSYEEIQSEIWKNVIVSPETLSQRVKLLRNSLGDDASQPRYIRVIRGEGLQLIPECLTHNPASARTRKSRRGSALIMTVGGAVLALLATWQYFSGSITSPTKPPGTAVPITQLVIEPFETTGEGSGNWVYSGILRTMSSHSLGTLRGLSVSRTAIGGVDSLVPSDNPMAGQFSSQDTKLSGSIFVDGKRLTITANLMREYPETTTWTQEYSGGSEQFLGIYQALLSDVIGILRPGQEAELADWIKQQPTNSPVAFNHYRQAYGSFFSQEDMIHSATLAIEADPNFAEAYALRAWANGIRLYGHSGRDAIERADMVMWKESVLSDSALAAEHGGDTWRTGFAQALMHVVSWNWSKADPLFLQAVQTEPGNVTAAVMYAHFLVITGREQRALAIMDNLVTVLPDNYLILRMHGVVHTINGDFFNARNQIERSLALNEADPATHRWLGIIMGMLGDFDAANVHLARSANLMGETDNTFLLSTLAYALSKAGNTDNAMATFQQITELEAAGVEVAPASWVLAHLAVNQTDRALQWMRAAVEQSRSGHPDPGFFAAYYLKANLMQDERLNQPEWISLRQQLGYKDSSPIGIN